MCPRCNSGYGISPERLPRRSFPAGPCPPGCQNTGCGSGTGRPGHGRLAPYGAQTGTQGQQIPPADLVFPLVAEIHCLTSNLCTTAVYTGNLNRSLEKRHHKASWCPKITGNPEESWLPVNIPCRFLWPSYLSARWELVVQEPPAGARNVPVRSILSFAPNTGGRLLRGFKGGLQLDGDKSLAGAPFSGGGGPARGAAESVLPLLNRLSPYSAPLAGPAKFPFISCFFTQVTFCSSYTDYISQKIP